MRPPKKTKRQKKRTKWLSDATRWKRVGEEAIEEEILITRISRIPPSFRLEYVRDDSKIMAAMMVKAPKGQRGFDIVLDGSGGGFRARTRREALRAFSKLHQKLEQAAPISAGDDND